MSSRITRNGHPGTGVRDSCLAQSPFCRVIFNVLQNVVIILLTSNRMVVIRSLEYLFAVGLCKRIDLLGYLVFIPPNHGSYCRGRVCCPTFLLV